MIKIQNILSESDSDNDLDIKQKITRFSLVLPNVDVKQSPTYDNTERGKGFLKSMKSIFFSFEP